jgi:hypothetical protein
MPRSLLPPRGIFAGTRLVFDRDLSASVKETLLQLMALSWGTDSHTTPALSYTLLEHLTGKNVRTLHGHMATLRSHQSVLRFQPAGSGQFIIIFSGWLFGGPDGESAAGKNLPAAGKNLHLPVKEEDDLLNPIEIKEQEESIDFTDEFFPPLNDHNAANHAPAKPTPAILAPAILAPEAAAPKAAKPLSKAVEKRLREAGVFPALMGEIASRASEGKLKDKDLLALLDWCAADQPERPAALFVARLRAGGRAPAEFYAAACPRCGERGRHSAECPRRYALPGS